MSVSDVSGGKGLSVPWRVLSALLFLLTFLGLGSGIAQFPPLALLLVAAAGVAFATRCVELLCVAVFWALPYMAINLPTGSFTLKLCDGTAYLFALSWAVRAALRREKILFPPATVPVLVYLAVLALSTAFEPPVPLPYAGDFKATDRNSPLLRSGSLVIWMAVSWLVVVALYNVVGKSRDMFRRCVCSHIIASGFVALLSLAFYAATLFGRNIALLKGHIGIFVNGDTLRLAGPTYEPLFFGFYLVITIPVTLIVGLYKPSWLPRNIVYFCLSLQAVAMLLTFSTGAWAGLLAAFVVLLPLMYRSIPRFFWVGLCVLAVLISVTAFTLPRSPVGKIVLGQINKAATGGTRKGEFEVGYALIGDYPVLGIGPAMATFYFGRYHPADRVQEVHGDQEINNAYINVMAESGIAGFLAFVWCGLAGAGVLALVIHRHGMRQVPVLAALTASLVGCAVQYTSLNSLFLVFFPVIIGLATAGARVASAGDAASIPAPRLSMGKAI